MPALEKEEKLIIRKMEKLLNILEENDKKENRDEKAIEKLKHEKNGLRKGSKT